MAQQSLSDSQAIASDYRAAAQDAARNGRFNDAATLLALASLYEPSLETETSLDIPITVEA